MYELDELLASLPGYVTLSTNMKQAALSRSLIPDSFGIWPGQDGYETTYDVYYAALSLVGYLQAQPFVRQESSEGTSVSVDAPDWAALIEYFRSQSRIVAATGNTVLQKVLIPEGPHVRRVNMKDRDAQYGDVNTDMG